MLLVYAFNAELKVYPIEVVYWFERGIGVRMFLKTLRE